MGMVSTTWTDELESVRRQARARHIRYWLSVLGLAVADGLSFVLAHFLFRAGASVPALVLFQGRQLNASAPPIDVFTVLALTFVAVRYLSGDYGRRQLFWDGAKTTTIALMITALPDLGMMLLGGNAYHKTPILLSWLSLLFLVPIMRQGMRFVMSRAGVWQIPTALIGTGARSAEIFQALQGSLSLGFDVRWLVIEDTTTSPPPGLGHLKPIHSTDPTRIAITVCREGCKEAIVTAKDMQSSHFSEVVQRLLEVNVPVAIIPSLSRLPLANVSTNYFFGRDILMMQVRSNVQRLPWRIIKRGFDIAVSFILLLLLSPVFAAVAVAIRRTDPGSAFYAARRIGRYGKPFACYKFRTMVSDAEARLQAWRLENPELYEEFLKTFKLKNDPRVTPIGNWLRRTSLDELPQLWNVLRGDMSLVGPRPVVQQELTDYYGPASALYMRTRPGITGLWQVSGRSDTSYDQRIILDEWYILNWSFWYDIVILIQTAWIVIARKGAF